MQDIALVFPDGVGEADIVLEESGFTAEFSLMTPDGADFVVTANDDDIVVVLPSIQSNAEFQLADALESAVLVRLFTDRRAADDDELPAGPGSDRRGWWANDELGSRLWLLERATRSNETLRRAENYAREALDGLTYAGQTVVFSVEASIVDGLLYLAVDIERPEPRTLRVPVTSLS